MVRVEALAKPRNWIRTCTAEKTVGEANFQAAVGRTTLLLAVALNLAMLFGPVLALMVAKVSRGQRMLRKRMLFLPALVAKLLSSGPVTIFVHDGA